MNDIKNQENPTDVAEYFSSIQERFGYTFDFTINSLEKEVDRFLEDHLNLSEYTQTIISSLLTAYIGETVCRVYKGKWCGEFFGPLSKVGSNYYLCWVEIDDFKFWPSHFIEQYLKNGKEKENSFYHYLYSKDKNKGVLLR